MMELLIGAGLSLVAIYLLAIVYLLFSGAAHKMTNKGDWGKAKEEAAMAHYGTTDLGLFAKIMLNIVALRHIKKNWKSWNSL